MIEKDIADAIVAEHMNEEKSSDSRYPYVEIRSNLMPPEQRMRVKKNRKAFKGRRHISSESTAKEALQASQAINMTYSSGLEPRGAKAYLYGDNDGVVVNGIYKWAIENGYEVLVEEDVL